MVKVPCAIAVLLLQDALLWYKRAVDKADYRHEFYFGLSRAYWATGMNVWQRRIWRKP